MTAPVNSMSRDELLAMTPPELVAIVEQFSSEVAGLKHQLEWLKRQMFGRKSERFIPDAQQPNLGAMLPLPETKAPEKMHPVAAHTRRSKPKDLAETGDSLPFFDRERVPVETIELPNPEIEGLTPDQYRVIDKKVSYRLAQRPGSYVVLEYVRPVIKRLDTQTISCPAAPVGVLQGSRADVSFVTGMLIDKFLYHCPLYRVHQKLTDAGFRLTRQWLTQLAQQTIMLLQPIYAAQCESILTSRVLRMDEVPIKAGREAPGKMRQSYFWPILGELGEIDFRYADSRKQHVVFNALGKQRPANSVLVTDGYAVYAAYAEQTGITHALCWAHARREFFEAMESDRQGVIEALGMIRELYAVEETIAKHKLTGEIRTKHRLEHSKPIVERFFAWIDEQFQRQGLLPSNPFTKALNYARERRVGLEVFLTDPDVPIDNNKIERRLRPIPMGRKNWNFCWTELGAKHVGIIQSLLSTCRMQGIDPYTYLVDVLQRVGEHPNSRVAELTPRRWKEQFAAHPLRSDLGKVAKAG